jgi:biopolymer transport protein ExbD
MLRSSSLWYLLSPLSLLGAAALAACSGGAKQVRPARPAVEVKADDAVRPTPRKPRLRLSRDAIALAGGGTLRLDPRLFGPARPCDRPVDRLARLVRGTRSPLAIEASPDVTFALLCPVLRALWAAGIDRVQLSVSGRAAFVEVHAPSAAGKRQQHPLLLTVVVADSGFYVGGAGGILPGPGGPGPTLPTSGGAYAYGKLSDKLREVKRSYPAEREVLVTADGAVPAQVILRAVRAVSGHTGSACIREQGCLFERVVVERFAAANPRLSGGLFLEQVGGSTRPRPAPAAAGTTSGATGGAGAPRAIVRPSVKGTTPATSTASDMRAALVAINSRYRQLRGCYERTLARDPALKGQIVLLLRTDAGGRVTRMKVSRDTIGDPQLIDCLRAEVRSWQLPGGNEYQVPLIFSPDS